MRHFGLIVSCVALIPFALNTASAEETSGTQKPIGYDSAGAMMTPVNQIVTPFGELLDLPGLRPQAVALSPDGKLSADGGEDERTDGG